ncbi:MAG: tyrosine-protein phosphatase [Sphingomonadales bacterium]|nr:tyrosine-protein phosphatase [Sphingomonadales bacterium]
MIRTHQAAAALAAALFAAPVLAAPPAGPTAERDSAGALAVHWTSPDPVDVLVADRADVPAARARLVAARDRDGSASIADGSTARSYVLLRNARTGETARVAERLLPLEGGSNFRDIGGYGVAGGKHVRWGLIYRSGGTPLLTEADRSRIAGLGLANMVDLRSDEERVLAPSRIDGVPYAAVGYSMASLHVAGGMEGTYRGFPTMLAPQLRLIFAKLLRGEGPLVYNCSAGQDRTGFATAMVLSALGAPRETIIADYHLSTAYRRPENEMPKIDPGMAAANPVAAMFASYQRAPSQKPQPLKTAEGKAFLSFALEEIEAKWGSVDGYLKAELGLGPTEIRSLRARYTE